MSSTRGTPLPLTSSDVEPWRDRLMARVVIPTDPTACWGWTSYCNYQGYAQLGDRGAHRVSYVLFAGDLAAGDTVDHLCRNRACVNPFHLEAVPIEVNVMRGEGACVQHSRKTACPKGHPYETKHRYDGKTQRYCPTCDREYKREWARRRRGTTPEGYRV